jgi:hypothetical protein
VERRGRRDTDGRSVDSRDMASGLTGRVEAEILLDGPHRQRGDDIGGVLGVLLRARATGELVVDDEEGSQDGGGE